MWNSFALFGSQVVIGGINVDFIAKGKTETLVVSSLLWNNKPYTDNNQGNAGLLILTSEKLPSLFFNQFGQTNPGSVCQSFGGVGRNIAGKNLCPTQQMTVCQSILIGRLKKLWHFIFKRQPLFFVRLFESARPQSPVHLGYRHWLSQRGSDELLSTYGRTTPSMCHSCH